MFAYIDRFNRYAVKYELSAAAILFWQYLCFTMAQKNQFERLQQDTAALMQALQITRQGLIGVRKSLERAGLLAVERDENQKAVVYAAAGWEGFAACWGSGEAGRERAVPWGSYASRNRTAL